MLEVISGSMYSGKSAKLIDRMLRASIAKKTTAVFKPDADNRYAEGEVVSHDGFRVSAHSVPHPAALLKAWSSLGEPEVVGVDEVQFFGPQIVEVLDGLANKGVRVVVAGLSMNFLNEPFSVTSELLARADRVDMMLAVCHTCFEPTATRSQLINKATSEVVVKAKSSFLVGGEGLYEARCRKCFEHEGDE